MAGNKGRKRLDQPAGNTLSAIDRALLDLVEKPIQHDEFTIDMLMEKNPSDTARRSMMKKLDEMVSKGKLVTRKLPVKGKQTNVYRYVD